MDFPRPLASTAFILRTGSCSTLVFLERSSTLYASNPRVTCISCASIMQRL